ncbi:MAG TPA: wax ester/triacylglycerol synthase family O-acyltransferase [Candidatus Eisenbacteria bacterium]|nr:wax ester/triacylglycerol synthase family O-acyltransferase [Candidatus Eisenbacteria bacterium]
MGRAAHHERLSALDATFLAIEDRCSHMHIGSVGVFEAEPGMGSAGALDLDSVHHLVSVVLDSVPRYHQRVETTPIFGHPVWVDDASFNLNYHLRHTRLPLPGDERQLKRLAGRVMSQQLDRGKPLWESWFVEGLEGNRFAVVSKVHHCMVDGIGGVEMTTATLRPAPGPDPRLAEQSRPFQPRPVPRPRELVCAELWHRLGGALGFAGAAARGVTQPRATASIVGGTLEGLAESLTTAFRPASPTPLNVAIGPHRRFDWTAIDLAVVKAVRTRLGGTVNDVVLAVVAGAMRRYLGARGVDVDRLDFRAMVPVNLRAGYGGTGNRVASVLVRLPVDVADMERRLQRVRQEMETAKHSHQIDAARAIEDITDWTMTTLIAQSARLASVSQPFNLVVTNVPGPQFPLYFLGARLVAAYPLVPLFQRQALGIALFSYDGRLFWGINADWDAVPDVHDLVAAIDTEFRLLGVTAGAEPAATLEAAV